MQGNGTLAAAALVIAQVVHGFTPAETESEGYTGAIVGLILLITALAALFGHLQRRSWAPMVLGWTGAVVAVGFVAYHATPFRSPFTNPYVGEPVRAAAWISAAVAVAVGAWAAYEGLAKDRSPAPAA